MRQKPPLLFDAEFLLAVGKNAPSLEEKYQCIQVHCADSEERRKQLDHFLLDTLTRQRQGLLDAHTALEQCQTILKTFSQPPWYPARYLGSTMRGQGPSIMVLHGGTRRLVNLGEGVAEDSLIVGDEVLLSHDLNVVMAKSANGISHSGETAVVEQQMADGRLLLRWRDEEVVVEVAGALRAEVLKHGDRVRWDRSAAMVLEKIDHVSGQHFLLDEVPDLHRDCVGGQTANLEILLSTLTTTLVDPAKAKLYGLTGRQSILLEGPPGVGKTLLAQVAAAEVARLSGQRCRFGVVKPAEWESPWVGETQQNIRHCFQALRDAAQEGLAVLFLDEIESIGRVRGITAGQHSDKFLAALLAELDGFADRNSAVAIIAATNRKDLVDPALLERLSGVEIAVRRPDMRGAEAIFAIHLPTSLPYSPNGASAPYTRQELIETAVSQFYSPNAGNALCTLRFRDGKTRLVTARELVSGRIFAQVCRAAQQAAFLRDVRGGTPGLQRVDIEDAIAQALERLASTLTVRNVHAYLSDLPQDVDVVSVEPVVRKLPRPHHYRNVA